MRKFLSLFLAFVVAFGAPLPSYAGYAQLKPPPGWSTGMGAAVPGQAGVFNFGKAANDAITKGGTVLTNASLNVGGKMITVPVGMRVAANAATFAASYSFGNPWIFGTLAVGSAAYNWFKESGFEVKNGVWVQSDPNVCSAPPCIEYFGSPFGIPITGIGTANAAQAMLAALAARNPSRKYRLNHIEDRGGGAKAFYFDMSGNGGAVWDINFDIFTLSARTTAPSDPAFTPVGDPEFHQKLDPKPIPDAMPKQLPQIDWPIELPIFNPDPAVSPQPRPAPAPEPRPLWEPVGDPVKNPNPDRNPDGSPKPLPNGEPNPNAKPDTWTQPGVRVKPSPTPESPWQVDVNPENITKTDPSATPQESGQPSPNATPKPVTDAITCGLPGTPPCKIDEAGTPTDGEKPFEKAKTAIDTAKDAAKDGIESATKIEAPAWTFSFQLPTGCAPYVTGLRGVILNICEWQSTIHDLMSMIWAGSTFFCIAGMVGRTIRES